MTDVLYYDGRCGLCAGEIARLRRLTGDSLELADIHDLGGESSTDRPDRDTLLRTLHLRKSSGEWVVGADANVAAWRHTRYGWLWSWLRWPLLRRLVDPIYDAWAAWRYRRLYGNACSTSDGSCASDGRESGRDAARRH